ncbi:hypothetical protein ANANG_G00226430 [Anguilla anguilla]|uniref:Sfi1 spindle body domain-containing protein n=1 Tax=Anguilla anguilla TaxID=7936 RepID=A0A9D3RQN0_ANGAN|nr:hypothetical protein ANANG_G00226430 [Anguilla anguilla]
MLEHAAARRHWERSLRSRCLAQWSGAACLRRGKAILQREAERLHTRSLLLRCFSTWRRRGRVKLALWEPQDSAQLERRVVWLLRRAERRRLRSGLALWAARARQNLAVRLYHRRAVLTRVFVAWETWVWLDRERRLLVLQRLRCRLCRVALDRWRLHTQQQQEVRRRRANRLALQAKEILQRWHSYAQSRSRLRRLQCEHVERKRRRMKRTALLSWAEGAERLRRADISAQKSLKIRCLRQWHHRARCGARAGRAVEALETERTRRTLRGAFVLWRERWRSAEQRLLGRVRTAACHWRQRALQSRAEAHRIARLTNHALLRWRHAQARRERGGGASGRGAGVAAEGPSEPRPPAGGAGLPAAGPQERPGGELQALGRGVSLVPGQRLLPGPASAQESPAGLAQADRGDPDVQERGGPLPGPPPGEANGVLLLPVAHGAAAGSVQAARAGAEPQQEAPASHSGCHAALDNSH